MLKYVYENNRQFIEPQLYTHYFTKYITLQITERRIFFITNVHESTLS